MTRALHAVSRSTAAAAATAAAAVVTLAAITGCADFEGTVDPTFGLPDVLVESPTLTRDVQPIFDRRCAFGGCHSEATRQAGLVLVRGRAHDALVDQRSRLENDRTLVVPGDASTSWLMSMLGGDVSARRGHPRMPLAAAPLTDKQMATIARWIDRHAPENE